MFYTLPTTLTINGAEYAIRSDYRVVLDIITMLNDASLTAAERAEDAIIMLYEDIPDNVEEALKQCFWFINAGQAPGKKSPRLMDWEKDFPYIIAPINRVLGYEARTVEYLHWWSFLSAYMEMSECVMSQIVNIRSKLSKGKKLEKYEREWLRQNREIINLPQKYTAEDEEILKKWTGGG